MPLSVNVGLNRKASCDFQSSGASINITAELDATLLTRPQELQAAIDNLYQQAREALDRQVVPPRPPSQPDSLAGGNGQATGGDGHTATGNSRPMTERQRSAICAIARQTDRDPGDTAREAFGVDFDRLTATQASQLIDRLKDAAATTRPVRRSKAAAWPASAPSAMST